MKNAEFQKKGNKNERKPWSPGAVWAAWKQENVPSDDAVKSAPCRPLAAQDRFFSMMGGVEVLGFDLSFNRRFGCEI